MKKLKDGSSLQKACAGAPAPPRWNARSAHVFNRGSESEQDLGLPQLDFFTASGAMFFLAVSSHDPNVVLVRCDMTGAYISLDADRSWRMFNLRSPVDFLGYDPETGPQGPLSLF